MKLYIIIITWHVAVIIMRVLASGALLTEAEWGATDPEFIKGTGLLSSSRGENDHCATVCYFCIFFVHFYYWLLVTLSWFPSLLAKSYQQTIVATILYSLYALRQCRDC